jgi:hypothetical protein
MTPEKYFRKWSENCRIFIDYKPIHSHEDMMQFAKDYHAEQLTLNDVSNQREFLIAFLMDIEECYGMDERDKTEKFVEDSLKN